MLKKITVAAILLISIASCKTKDAFNYSQDFVKKETSLLADITATEDNVTRYVSAEQYDSIAVAGERMEKLVEVKLQEVKKAPAPDVKEGENFKEACIKYFQYIKSMYTGYKEFGLAPTDTERQAVQQRIMELSRNKQAAITAMQTAQKKFADANGFRIEK
ncbi:MAG: hypothetical protein ABIO79_12355 [Ferruginibacter sp.]